MSFKIIFTIQVCVKFYCIYIEHCVVLCEFTTICWCSRNLDPLTETVSFCDCSSGRGLLSVLRKTSRTSFYINPFWAKDPHSKCQYF